MNAGPATPEVEGLFPVALALVPPVAQFRASARESSWGGLMVTAGGRKQGEQKLRGRRRPLIVVLLVHRRNAGTIFLSPGADHHANAARSRTDVKAPQHDHSRPRIDGLDSACNGLNVR